MSSSNSRSLPAEFLACNLGPAQESAVGPTTILDQQRPPPMSVSEFETFLRCVLNTPFTAKPNTTTERRQETCAQSNASLPSAYSDNDADDEHSSGEEDPKIGRTVIPKLKTVEIVLGRKRPRPATRVLAVREKKAQKSKGAMVSGNTAAAEGERNAHGVDSDGQMEEVAAAEKSR
jgi:hypothetical protein